MNRHDVIPVDWSAVLHINNPIQVCIGAAVAPHWKGPYTRVQDDPIIPCAGHTFNFEDPTVW